MSDNPVMVTVEARKTALDNAVYLSVAQEEFDANEVIALAEKFTEWIMTGETPQEKFARVEAERFFRERLVGPRPAFTIVDEINVGAIDDDTEVT